MPFQSEKQRRFMWAEHPEIAKRWAHEYPNQKNLPTYAHEDRDKKPDAEKEEKQSEFSAANAARDTLVAGGASTIGTTAGLAGAAALANHVGSPVLGNLFRNAAKESLLFFNPVRSFRLLRRLPRAAVLASNQLELSDRLIHATIPKTFKGVTPKQINKATQAYKDVTRLQRQTQKYHTLHGELPGETLEKGIGVANGVMNLGVGGAVGLLPHLTGSASTPAPPVPQPVSSFGKWAQVYQWPVLRTQAYLQLKTAENQEAAEKKEAHMARNVTTRCNDYKNTAVQYIQSLIHKHANSAAVPVEIPHSEKPVSAGEESVSLKGPDQEGQLLGQLSTETRKPPVNETLHKLAVVLSQVLQQQIADEQAAQQGQEAQQVPQNVNMKQYAQPAAATPLPMGMAQAQSQQMQAAMPGAAPQAQAPQAPAAAPQKTANVSPMPAGPQATAPSAPPVGAKGLQPIKPLAAKQLGPSTRPIQTFGGISTDGDWGNPNAGLGVQNSPETKLAADPQYSSKPFDPTIGYKHPDQNATPEMIYKNQMMRSKNELAAKQRNPNYQFSNAYMAGARHYGTDANGMVIPPRPPVTTPQSQAGANVRQMMSTGSPALRQSGLNLIRTTAPQPQAVMQPYPNQKGASASPAWQRSAGKNDEGGLNAKGRASYNKATGGHLKAPVTEKHPTGKAKARRHSFCSRMCGMKSKNTGGDTAKDPDSRINKSLRKWNCKCSSAMQFGVYMGRIG